MRSYTAFMKKEFVEQLRNKKVLVLGIVFIIVGIMGPVFAKFMPEIVKSVNTNGMTINIPAPVEADAWVYFFQNISQTGIFVLVIVLGNHISSEFSRGTLINLLAKGLPRWQVVIAKWSSGILMWIFAYLLAVLTAWVYTAYLFGTEISTGTILTALFLQFVFGIFIISIELLGGIIFGSMVGSLCFTGVFVVVQTLISIKEDWAKYMPIYLSSHPADIIKSSVSLNLFCVPFVASVLVIILSLWASVFVMNKKCI